MTSQEIERELENVERICTANTQERDVLAATAKGIWVIALHLARFSEANCEEIKDLRRDPKP